MPSKSSSALYVRHLLSDEHELLRELRLSALASNPDAFGSTHAREAAQPPQWWKRWAADSEAGKTARTFLLVDDRDRRLGLAFARIDDCEPRQAWLGGMWISPDARGRRAAGLLCAACVAWAAERGARDLSLTVVVGNDVAQRAYEAAGFSLSGRTTSSAQGRTLEEFVMARPL